MFLRIWYDKSAEEVESYNEKGRDGAMKKKLVIIGTVALLGVKPPYPSSLWDTSEE